MDVYWLEQHAAHIPTEDTWLSAGDETRLNSMRFQKRRDDWQLGRWTAKLAVAAYLNLPSSLPALAEIEIRPAPSGAPEVYLANQPADVTISLSHRDGMAICAIATPDAALGCDLEIVEPRSDAFVTDYFTAQEQAFIAQAHAAERFQLLALLWSAKESALKAMRTGLRLDTRSVVVSLVNQEDSRGEESTRAFQLSDGPGWHPLSVRCRADQIFQGWWQHDHNVLRTLVAAPSPSQPTPLSPGICSFERVSS